MTPRTQGPLAALTTLGLVLVLSGVSCEGRAGTDSCDCFSSYTNNDSLFIENACSESMLCETLEVSCPGPSPGCPVVDPEDSREGVPTVSDRDALRCILTALSDGAEGTLEWRYTSADNPGFATLYRTLHVLPGRRVIEEQLHVIDLSGMLSPVAARDLMPGQTFAACLQEDELEEQLACLVEPTRGDALEVCVSGGWTDR